MYARTVCMSMYVCMYVCTVNRPGGFDFLLDDFLVGFSEQLLLRLGLVPGSRRTRRNLVAVQQNVLCAIRLRKYVRVCLYVCMYVHIYVCICMNVCMQCDVYIYSCIYVSCMYVCMYVYGKYLNILSAVSFDSYV